jgi:DNA polymerase family A
MDDTAHFIPLDIETGDADRLYEGAPDPAYVRLVGVGGTAFFPRTGPVRAGVPYVTVNGHLFDFPALDRHTGIPVEQTIPFSRDLRVAAFQHDPPTTYETSSGPGFKSYAMGALCSRYLGDDAAKSDLGEELAKEYGGWDRIPESDPRYADYLRSDLDNTRRLNAAIPWDPYEEREAWVATLTARATLTGFRVDVPGLTARAEHLAQRAEDGRALLSEKFGFPLLNKAGKLAAAPQRTAEGKAAFEAALNALGCVTTAWPRGKDGSLSLGKDVLATVAEHLRPLAHPALAVVEAVQEMNGIRNSAANLLRHTNAHDGRARYTFEPFQSTGRWSCGLTVLKKGVADSERAFLTADGEENDPDGHVLVSIDADQIDIRGVAAHAQDPALIALLNDGSRDFHQEIADMTGVERKYAKTLDLGWLYGRGAKGMAENTPGVTMHAALGVTGYMARAFPGVVSWQARTRELGTAGVLLDNGFGRRLRVDPQRAHTQAPAMIGQSTTRDVIAECLIDLARTAPDVLPMLRVIVHDEVVLSVPKRNAEEIARIVQSCMSRQWAPAGASIPVNITAGQGKPFVFAYRWNDLYM